MNNTKQIHLIKIYIFLKKHLFQYILVNLIPFDILVSYSCILTGGSNFTPTTYIRSYI